MKNLAAFWEKHYNRTSDCPSAKEEGIFRRINMRVKRIAALLLSSIIAVSALTGCGVDKDAVVATLDDKEISLGVANFAARLQQAQYDDFYVAYMGEDVWKSDMYGTGETMEDMTKDSVLTVIQEMYLLQAHMDDYSITISEDEANKIAEAAAKFMSDNEDDAIKALGATEDIVEEYLTLLTVQNKMYNAIIADVDTEVSDEDANTSAYSYVSISKTSYTDEEGNTVEYTDEEKENLLADVKTFLTEAKEQGLETAAEGRGYTVSTGIFSADDTTLDEAVLTALQALTTEGELSEVVETDNLYYVLRMDALTDEEATEEHREEIIEERKSDLYDEVAGAWKEASEWTVNEKVWESVTFDNLFTLVEPTTESVDGTEVLETTEE